MKKIATLICAILSTIVISAQQQVDEVTLVTFGDGPTKQEAINVALRSAIEQTFGAFVSANTDILNDELVKDEIVTVTSGNVKTYKELSSSRLSNGSYSVSLQATVSARQLTTYAQGHGAKTEFAGAMFGQNQKLWDLNTKNEKAAIEHLIAKLEPLVSGLVNYELQVDEPSAHKGNPNLVDLNCTVVAKRTKTYDEFDKEIIATLEALALSQEQIQLGKQLGKNIVQIFYDGEKFQLRSEDGADYLANFLENVHYYLREFDVRYNTNEGEEISLDYNPYQISPLTYRVGATLPVEELNKITGLQVKRWDYDENFKNYRIPFPHDLLGEKDGFWFQPVQGRNEFNDFVSELKKLGAKPFESNGEIYDDIDSRFLRELTYALYDEESIKFMCKNVAIVPMRMKGGRLWYAIYINDKWFDYAKQKGFGEEPLSPYYDYEKYQRSYKIEDNQRKYRVVFLFEKMDYESDSDFIKWCEDLKDLGERIWSHRKFSVWYYIHEQRFMYRASQHPTDIKYFAVELNYY